MKPWVKWSLIGFVGLAMLGTVIDALKSPEQKAAEAAKKAEATAQRAAESEMKKAQTAEQKAADEAAKIQQAKDALAALPTYTAKEMAADYEANTVSADMKYKGKSFKVTGKVTDINTSITGDPYLTMGGTNMFMQPQFGFDKESLQDLAALKKGMTVTVVCKGRGDIVKIPMSSGCELVPNHFLK